MQAPRLHPRDNRFSKVLNMQFSLDIDFDPIQQDLDVESRDTRFVHIEVGKLFAGHAHEDDGVAGIYCAEVAAKLPDDMAAACALGAFHSTFVVHWPESFRLNVFDIATLRNIEPDTDVDWVDLGKSCVNIEYLGA